MALLRLIVALAVTLPAFAQTRADTPLKILFLGDQGHHQPRQRAEWIAPILARSGIEVTYTEEIEQITTANLDQYDGLIVYANIDSIAPAQEHALLEYVAGGGGFIPLHCASFCFRNSPAVVDLIGAQFQKHGAGVFSTEIVLPEHPIMQGFGGFESWDETYVHTKHNERNRIVLEVRRAGEQGADTTEEPWTWVRTHGRGRVFYTAWGHDERTWGHAGFQNLLERGIRWACGDDPSRVAAYQDPKRFDIPRMTTPREDVAAFEFDEVGPKIPNYLAGEKWGTQGEVLTRMQKPLTPEESLQHFVTPEGFHLELFVSEPEIQGKPIAMNWDHRGRLWICETVDYPNQLMPPGEGRDRIRICEDTDGDGRADRFTVFAERLSIPSSLEFYRGGVLVQAGVETLYLRDNDGDDVADQRTVLISGWAMGDTHGGVSHFQYGLDNHYWAIQGYNPSQPKFAGGQHRGFRQGPFRFTVDGAPSQPQVTQVEFIRSTTNNSWGLGISEEGLIFASTANRAPSFFIPLPNRYYERVRGWTPPLTAEAIAADHYFQPITDRVRQVDHHGGYTAGAGHALYTARNYPQAWWNRTAFVCGPTGHLVGTFVLTPDGSSFRSRNAFNLVASDDEWSAPIMAEVGPDGNVWILDWYNYIVQHNPTPRGFTRGRGNAYESDLRDKRHGRIYRLVYDGKAAQSEDNRPPSLEPKDPQSLLAALQHPNRLWRRHAQRLLVERGKVDVVPALIAIAQDTTVDAVNNNAGVVHALWTLRGLNAVLDPREPAFEVAVEALSHRAAGVRRNATLVLPASPEATLAMASAKIVFDDEPQVRLGALMALADMPASTDAGELLASLIIDERTLGDRYLREALICSAAMHAEHFLPQALSRLAISDAKHSPACEDVLRIVAEHFARSGIHDGTLGDLLARLAEHPSPWRRAVVTGLADGWPSRREPTLTSTAERALQSLLEHADTSELGPLLKLGTAWGSTELTAHRERLSSSLFERLEDEHASIDERLTAADELAALVGSQPDAVRRLVQLITPRSPPRLARGLIRVLAGATAENVARELIDAWPTLTPSLRDDVIAVLIARPQTTRAMLAAVDAGGESPSPIAVSDLSLDQQQTLLNHPDAIIRQRGRRWLQSSGNLIRQDRQQVVDQYTEALHEPGDPAQGERLFVKNCANCHRHSGQGNEVGPDLTGMAVHPKEELLVHILDPSRSVEGNFRRYTLLTVGDRIWTGMLAAESLTAVELIDAEGKRHAISREDIQQIRASNQSLMPEGLEQQLSPQAMVDLLEFLTLKGKFVPLPIGAAATAVSTRGLFSARDDGPDRMIFRDWGAKVFHDIPFQLVDPLGTKRANIVLLHGPQGSLPPRMPREVSLPCNMVVRKLHLLSGVAGWAFPLGKEKSVCMVVRLRYEDGQSEDHPLLNGVHFADYIRRVDVPESEFAFALRKQQVRYLAIQPKRRAPIVAVDLIKGDNATAPMVLAVTAERYQ